MSCFINCECQYVKTVPGGQRCLTIARLYSLCIQTHRRKWGQRACWHKFTHEFEINLLENPMFLVSCTGGLQAYLEEKALLIIQHKAHFMSFKPSNRIQRWASKLRNEKNRSMWIWINLKSLFKKMNFEVIEFGVLSNGVWPLSLLTPVATQV